MATSVLYIICLIILISDLRNLHASEHLLNMEDREVELQTIRSQIKNVESNISSARQNVDEYLLEIEKNEKAIASISINIEKIESNINAQEIKLDKLRAEGQQQEETLNKERSLLAEQIRTAYKTGRHDFFKLLLNQERPDKIGRMMAYHDYFNRARSERISEITITLNNLKQLESAINNESRELEALKIEQLNELTNLSSYRDERRSAITELNQYISEQDRYLVNLQQNEQELSNLIEDLKNKTDIVQLYENLPPFGTLKGKLNWPVNGSLITRFGSPKREGKLRWNGVRISANTGNDVHAVSAGKVIFADWFRNLGLLMIIDHGEGFMSLYGHNERLLKKADDFVNTGEIVAKVGNTGGQIEPALYFEIRQQGAPVNPGLWCEN